MGLFTGFSVISGIEIIYWIWFKVLLLQAHNRVFIVCFPQVIFHKKDQVAPIEEPKEPPAPVCCGACDSSASVAKIQEVEKELQDQQSVLQSQKTALEDQQKEIEELKIAVKLNNFSEAGRVFDSVFKPPPTIVEEVEEELKEEAKEEKEVCFLTLMDGCIYVLQETTNNDSNNVDDLEKELAEIVIDTPPIILAEVSQTEF